MGINSLEKTCKSARFFFLKFLKWVDSHPVHLIIAYKYILYLKRTIQNTQSKH